MKSKVLQHTYVIGLFDSGLPKKAIAEAFSNTISEHLNGNNNASLLPDWTMIFSFIYNNTESIVIARKNRSIPKEREKEVIVHIPIPSTESVSWGVGANQYISRSKPIQINQKYAETVEFDPSNYRDMASYISAAGVLAINTAFELGITVNGVRVHAA